MSSEVLEHVADLVEELDVNKLVDDIRWLHRLTYGQVAEALGVHRQTLYSWRVGDSLPSYTHERALRLLASGEIGIKQHPRGDISITIAKTPHIAPADEDDDAAPRLERGQSLRTYSAAAASCSVPILDDAPDLLARAMQKTGASESQVAQAIGVTPRTVARWKRARSRPSLSNLAALWCLEAGSHHLDDGRLVPCEGDRCGPPRAVELETARGETVKGWIGGTTRVRVPNAEGLEHLPAVWALVPASALVASHNPFNDFAPDDDYDQSLQEREYRQDTERDKVRGGAARLDPAMLLTDEPSALNGAPIITSRLEVLGGNGRTMMIQLAKNRHPARWRDYLEQLAESLATNKRFDLSAHDVRADVADRELALVRMLTGTYDARDISRALNRAVTLDQGADVDAIALGRMLPLRVIERIGAIQEQHDESWSETLRRYGPELVRELRSANVITRADLPRWVAMRRGQPTEQLAPWGREQLRLALMGAMVPDIEALTLASPQLTKLWSHIAPSVLALRADLQDERYDPFGGLGLAARDIADAWELDRATFRDRVAQRSLTGERAYSTIYETREAAYAAAFCRHWRRSYARAGASLRRYLAAIPPEAKGGGGMFERTDEELEQLGLNFASLAKTHLLVEWPSLDGEQLVTWITERW